MCDATKKKDWSEFLLELSDVLYLAFNLAMACSLSFTPGDELGLLCCHAMSSRAAVYWLKRLRREVSE